MVVVPGKDQRPGRRRPLGVAVRMAGGMAIALAFFGLIELVLRLTGIPDPGLYEGDRAQLWYVRPHLERLVPHPDSGSFDVQTNALGLRGEPPPDGQEWTLALGCSTTFGWGVEASQAWPARLGALLGAHVVNGGVPGWSTHQAVHGAGRYLDRGPSAVILAYGVRDAQTAHMADKSARPTPWLLQTRFASLIRRVRDPSATPVVTVGVPRVSPTDFQRNVEILMNLAGTARVTLMAFPQRSDRAESLREWWAGLAQRGPVVAPMLDDDAFFPSDPIHLTEAGHQALAQQLAAALSKDPAP